MSLINQQCIPCQGGIPPLNNNQIDNLLKKLKLPWQLNNLGHLYYKFKFQDFRLAAEFLNKVVVIAEQENHHPKLTINYGYCEVELWTHKINGIAENDFILAAKIELLT